MSGTRTVGTVAEARAVVWENLATLADAQATDNVWPDEWDEPARRRLVKAAKDVAKSIRTRLANSKKERR